MIDTKGQIKKTFMELCNDEEFLKAVTDLDKLINNNDVGLWMLSYATTRAFYLGQLDGAVKMKAKLEGKEV